MAVLSIGVVRENPAACPLNTGYNFLANPYPMDLSPIEMGFDTSIVDGSGDPTQADQIYVWDGNTIPTSYSESYNSYFFLEGFSVSHGVSDRWLDVGDNDITNVQDTAKLFVRDRATFFYRNDLSCLESFMMPLVWSP